MGLWKLISTINSKCDDSGSLILSGFFIFIPGMYILLLFLRERKNEIPPYMYKYRQLLLNQNLSMVMFLIGVTLLGWILIFYGLADKSLFMRIENKLIKLDLLPFRRLLGVTNSFFVLTCFMWVVIVFLVAVFHKLNFIVYRSSCLGLDLDGDFHKNC